MAGILYQKNRRIKRNHSCYSYLVDIKSVIEIQLMAVYPLSKKYILNPPFPETRFFEIEIDEVQKDGRKNYVLSTIVPVHARKKPDRNILKFIIKRGSWSITERIHTRTNDAETQWLYTDDFNILYLSSGGRHDHEMLFNLIIRKLDTIAQSITSGTRIPSEFENQLACRNAFDNQFYGGVDEYFFEAVLSEQYPPSHYEKTQGVCSLPECTDICSNYGTVAISPQETANVSVNLDQIEELRDLSWLTD